MPLAPRALMRPAAMLAIGFLISAAMVALPAQSASALVDPQPCAAGTGGTWTPGELNVYWFDVEQGDGQLLVGPSGKTMLIDLGETAWNRTSGTNAQRVAQAIKDICGLTTPVHLDYVMGSHHHLDHIGYAGNPNDGSSYGNGIWELLNPAELGFGVGTLFDRDGGTWSDSDGNGDCDVGTSASPSADVVWHNAGTVSQTGRRWICWLYGPDGQADRAAIQGNVVTLTNSSPWPSIDLGTGVTAEILQANAKGVMQADGVTAVSGDHTGAATPPSENDYSVAVRFAYGDYEYATAGDSDGEYTTSSFGYSYNDIEAGLAPLFGDVETMRLNHHGSGHSSSTSYTDTLAPETAVISCGNNSYGHPATRVTGELAAVTNSDGVGADVYMTNNPCDTSIGTVPGAFNDDGDIWLHTTGDGAGYVFEYDTGSNSYSSHAAPPPGTGDITIAEARFRGPSGAQDEFVELLNVSGGDVDLSGWALQACAAGSGAATNRAVIPSSTVLAAGQRYLIANTGWSGTVTPDLTYASGISDNGGARVVTDAVATIDGLGSSSGATDDCREGAGLSFPTGDDDVSFHRDGDGTSDSDDNVADFTGPAASTPTNAAGDTGGAAVGTVADVVINEYLADPNTTYAQEWVELHNPTGGDLDVSGLWIDDIASGGSTPKQIPASTIIPAGGHWVMTWGGGFLNNGGDDVRLLSTDQSTAYDAHTYTSSADDQSMHRMGDGGAWCTGLSTTVTQGSANPVDCT